MLKYVCYVPAYNSLAPCLPGFSVSAHHGIYTWYNAWLKRTRHC